jgi:hypothetical protein
VGGVPHKYAPPQCREWWPTPTGDRRANSVRGASLRAVMLRLREAFVTASRSLYWSAAQERSAYRAGEARQWISSGGMHSPLESWMFWTGFRGTGF